MADLTGKGYQIIRDHFQSECKFVEIYDTLGLKISRISIDDIRINWVHQEGAQRLEAMLILDGSNTDIPIPCKMSKLAIFNSAESTDALAEENFSAFEIQTENDLLFIRIQIEIPDIL